MHICEIIDHFCGAGGESTGIVQAAEELGLNINLHAHNHWDKAIETHSKNHPYAIHRQAKIEDLDPVRCVKSGRAALMWASPECTHHSIARGGRPCSDQSRASAMQVIKWAQELYIDRIIVENVPEFLSWGPLGANGRPLKSKRGETFRAWVGMLKSLGYRVDWRLLRASDYGDPTTRKRLFVQAVRGKKKIVWPEPTHSEHPEIFNHKPWVPASEIIDWNVPSQSIFTRKRPLAESTIRRIEAGIKKFWGDMAEPFICVLRGTSDYHLNNSARKLQLPLPTVATSPGHFGLIEPFLTKFHGGSGSAKRNYSLNEPISTLDCSNRFGLVQPFMMATGQTSSGNRVRSLDKPLSTVVTKAEHCLVEPLLVEYYGNGKVRPISEPIPTVTCKDRFGVIEGTYKLDIRFRMLQPHELAAAQGFPKDYWFSGNKSEQVKQIGNAVCPGVAKALAKVALAN